LLLVVQSSYRERGVLVDVGQVVDMSGELSKWRKRYDVLCMTRTAGEERTWV
jgi:hypothetical protein